LNFFVPVGNDISADGRLLLWRHLAGLFVGFRLYGFGLTLRVMLAIQLTMATVALDSNLIKQEG